MKTTFVAKFQKGEDGRKVALKMQDGRKVEHCFSAGTKVQVCLSVRCICACCKYSQ